ncbi:hypothetical protein [Cellulomonas sp.]|uniref:hypothetical protein n=1 Tax=Cellulomonas sp. TaxID=40001 RepID=UPI002588DFB6|nr:hypothetical protein [Cellulomonas sp.]MCR6688769.1 hypothetical protein [Cellulomonas sp.]
MNRDLWSVLVDLDPGASTDGATLARARERVDAQRSGVVHLDARRKRAGRVLAVAALSAAAAALAVVLPVTGRSGQEPPSPVAQLLGVIPAAAVGAGCSNEGLPVPGPSDPDAVVPRDQWSQLPEVAGLLAVVGDRTADSAFVVSGPALCDAIPVAVLHDPAGERGIVVFRDVTEPFRGAEEILTDATVRGYPAQVLSPPAGHHFISWTDDAGIRWFAQANGVTVPELTAVLDEALDDEGFAAAPPGFRAVPVPPHDAAGTVYRWAVQYDEGPFVYLEVTSPARVPVEVYATWPGEREFTTVGGHRAVFTPEDQGGAGLRWTTDAASFRLIVEGADLASLREIAEHLEPVTVDDPRISGR